MAKKYQVKNLYLEIEDLTHLELLDMLKNLTFKKLL